MADIVYILTNEAMPGLIKIGCTNGELAHVSGNCIRLAFRSLLNFSTLAKSAIARLLKTGSMMHLAITA
nr:hypothetical protein [Nitrobacter sp.]